MKVNRRAPCGLLRWPPVATRSWLPLIWGKVTRSGRRFTKWVRGVSRRSIGQLPNAVGVIAGYMDYVNESLRAEADHGNTAIVPYKRRQSPNFLESRFRLFPGWEPADFSLRMFYRAKFALVGSLVYANAHAAAEAA